LLLIHCLCFYCFFCLIKQDHMYSYTTTATFVITRVFVCKWQRFFTAGCIKMPLGMKVGLGPGHIVLDGNRAPPAQKGHILPSIFHICLLWPNGCMHQDTTRYRGKPQPRRHCVRWTQLPLPKGAWLLIFGLCPLWPNGWMD